MDNKELNRENSLNIFYKLYPVLKVIDDNNNNIISKKVIFKDLDIDQCISSSKDVCEGILFVIDGIINIRKLSVDGDETNLYDIKQGEICHEALSCLLKYKPLNILGTALTKSKVCIIPIEIVKRYILVDSEFLSYLYKDIYEKFYTVIKKKEDKNNKSLEERLLEYFKNKNSKTIYITHRELAFEVDSTREVVSRKLKELEKRGVINLERGKVNILKDLKL